MHKARDWQAPTLRLTAILLTFGTTLAFGQLPTIELPKPATFQPVVIPGQNSPKYQPNNPKPNGLDIYEQDRQRQIQQQRQLEEIYRELEATEKATVKYDPTLLCFFTRNFCLSFRFY